MKLTKIDNPKEIWGIYKSSFPKDERRDYNEQVELLKENKYSLYSIYENELIGFVEVWQVLDYILIEHIAIVEKKRGLGYGTEILKKFLTSKVVGEVELPNTDFAKRRIRLYERLGFKLNKHEYYQPAYSKDKKPLKLYLMTYPDKINKKEFLELKNAIYSNLYSGKY